MKAKAIVVALSLLLACETSSVVEATSQLAESCPKSIEDRLDEEQKLLLRMVFADPDHVFRPFRPSTGFNAFLSSNESFVHIKSIDELPEHKNFTSYFHFEEGFTHGYPIRRDELDVVDFDSDWTLNTSRFYVDTRKFAYEDFVGKLGFFNVLPLTAKPVWDEQLFSDLSKDQVGQPRVRRIIRPTCEAVAYYNAGNELQSTYFFYSPRSAEQKESIQTDTHICYNFAAAAIYGLEGLKFENLNESIKYGTRQGDELFDAISRGMVLLKNAWELRNTRTLGLSSEADFCRFLTEKR